MLETLKIQAAGNINFIKTKWNSPLNSQAASDQQGRLWPSSEDVYHPLNPIYSCYLKKASDLEYFNVILLRDGAYMLLDFFFRFPMPKPSYGKLIVPAHLSFLVPKVWQPHVLCYKVRKDESKKLTKKLVFLAIGSECFMSWPIFKSQFKSWLEQFPKDAEVSAHFVTRPDPIDTDYSDKRLTFEFLTTFARYFDREIELLSAPEMKSKFSKAENSFINLDLYQSGNSLCSMELIASNSACPVYQRAQYDGFTGKVIGSWPITFNTHFDLFTMETRDSDFEEMLYTKKMTPSNGQSLPFPVIPKLLALMQQRLKIF